MKIVPFYHLAAMGHWREVALEQFRVLSRAGFDTPINVSFIGAENDYRYVEEVAQICNLQVNQIYRSTELLDFEYPPIRAIQKHCKNGEDEAILYFHGKGVSKVGHSPVHWWRWAMNAFVLNRWKQCAADLEHYDIAGFCWNKTPSPHFCGNFWWARSDWIRRLDTFDEYRKHRYTGWKDHRGPNYYQRYACELWLAQDVIKTPAPRIRSYYTAEDIPWSTAWWDTIAGREAKRIGVLEGA